MEDTTLNQMTMVQIAKRLAQLAQENPDDQRFNGDLSERADYDRVRTWWTEQIQTGAGIMDWEAGYIARDRIMHTASARVPNDDSGLWFEIAYWTPEKAANLNRMNEIPGMVDGRSGWTAVCSKPSGPDRSPYLYRDIYEAQQAVERYWLYNECEDWPADYTSLAPLVGMLEEAGYKVLDAH